jgi:hypothetical protein
MTAATPKQVIAREMTAATPKAGATQVGMPQNALNKKRNLASNWTAIALEINFLPAQQPKINQTRN